VLIGYLQGADVVAQAWNNVMLDGGMDRWRGHMDGLLLFGHPKFNPAQRDSIPAYSLDSGTFSTGGGGFFGRSGVATWIRTQESKHLMRSWCSVGDPICNATSTNNLATLYIGGNSVHASYKNVIAPSTGAEMGRWLVGHYPEI
jgi:Cutinase